MLFFILPREIFSQEKIFHKKVDSFLAMPFENEMPQIKRAYPRQTIQRTQDKNKSDLPKIIVIALVMLLFFSFFIKAIKNNKHNIEKKQKKNKCSKKKKESNHKKKGEDMKTYPYSEILYPESLVSQFIKEVKKYPHIIHKPEIIKENWNLGITSIKGNIKKSNEDYGIAFNIGENQVLVIADGCGGLPYGEYASYWAVLQVAHFIIYTLGLGLNGLTKSPIAVAEFSFLKAYNELALKGNKCNIFNVAQGLRTTLIIVIGNKEEYGFAYIGDGGGIVRRKTGKIDRFLIPQNRANQRNILEASLGPQIEGKPVIGSIRREIGDILIAGTDGVFECIDDSFSDDIYRYAIGLNGNLQKVTDDITKDLANRKEKDSYICDDNITLGIMGSKGDKE